MKTKKIVLNQEIIARLGHYEHGPVGGIGSNINTNCPDTYCLDCISIDVCHLTQAGYKGCELSELDDDTCNGTAATYCNSVNCTATQQLTYCYGNC